MSLFWRPTACALWFDFAELQGSTVHDLSGNGNHGTVYGAQWEKGRLIGALQLDGVDDRVVVPAFSKGPNISLEVLYMPMETNPVKYRVIISDRESTSDYFCMLYHIVNKMSIRAHVQTSADLFYIDSAYSMEKDMYFHVVMTYDSSTLRLYINGVEDANSPRAVSGTPVNTSNKIYIGKDGVESSPLGRISLARVYNRALSAAEVEQHYKYLFSAAKQQVPSKFVPPRR